MKRSILIIMLLSVIAIVALTSCSGIKQVPKFTSVENLYQVKMNSSIEDVITLFGSKPYNILVNQIDGYTIYTYKYKFVERKVNSKIVNDKGSETFGTEKYNGKMQTVYLFFKANKLVTLVTTEGRKDSPIMVMLDNTLYTMTKDREKYIFVPTYWDENKVSKKCKK